MKKIHRRVTSLLLSFIIFLAFMPAAAFAETGDRPAGETVRMVAGEVLSGYGGYVSKDPATVWVDGSGNLNAMKEGETGWVYVSAPENIEKVVPSYEKYDLNTYVTSAEGLNMDTEIYTIGEGGAHEPVGTDTSLEEGREIFVKVTAGEGGNLVYALSDITMNGSSFMDEEHFDSNEQAYVIKMPAKKSSNLRVFCKQTELRAKGSISVQAEKGGTLSITDLAELSTGSDLMKWEIVTEDGAAANNVVTYADRKSMAVVSFDDSGDIKVAVVGDNGELVGDIPCSGYLVPKGTMLRVVPAWTDSRVLSSVNAGSRIVDPGEAFSANRDFRITYISSNPLVSVSESGLVRVRNIKGGKGGRDFYPRAIELVKKTAQTDAAAPASAPAASAPAAPAAAPTSSPAAEPAAETAPIDKGLSMDISKRGVMTLRWGRVSGASGYDIYVRTNDGKKICSKKTATVRSGKLTKKTLRRLYGKKISRRNTYRFVVKAYKKKGRDILPPLGCLA